MIFNVTNVCLVNKNIDFFKKKRERGKKAYACSVDNQCPICHCNCIVNVFHIPLADSYLRAISLKEQ